MIQQKELKKRVEHNYDELVHYDSISNREKVNYPITKMYVCEKVSQEKLEEEIKKNVIDYKYKIIGDLCLICASFHELNDMLNFQNGMNLEKNYNIKCEDVYYI